MRMFFHDIELYNKQGVRLEYIDKYVESARWSYNAIGGCATCELVLRREFDNYGDLDLDYEVQIWRVADRLYKPAPAGSILTANLPMPLGGPEWATRELRWRGFVSGIAPRLDTPETVVLRCAGYARQLAYISVPDDEAALPYSGDAGAIARQIIDTFVLPGSQIERTEDLHLCQDTGVGVTSVRFDTSAADVLSALAEIGGNAEWGVRADGEIYFMPRTDNVNHNVFIGDNVRYYESQRNTDEVIGRVHLRGANGFKATVTSTEFEPGRHKERIAFKPFLDNPGDATVWALAFMAKANVGNVPRGRIVIESGDGWVEGVGHPLGRFRVIGGHVFMKTGALLTANLPMQLADVLGGKTDQSYRINSVQYTPTESGLRIEIDLGEKSSGLADILQGFETRLSEQRQGLSL